MNEQKGHSVRALSNEFLENGFPIAEGDIAPLTLYTATGDSPASAADTSHQEVARPIDATSTHFRASCSDLYATGRPAEVAHLKTSDIASQRAVIHIRRGKGAEDRDVMLSPTLLDALPVYCTSMSASQIQP